MAAAAARGHGLSHELPARPPHRVAISYPGNIEGFSPDLGPARPPKSVIISSNTRCILSIQGGGMRKRLGIGSAALLLPWVMPAQSTFGTILGTVTDRTGAVVPGARIVITNQGENIPRKTVTDAQGNYEALNLKAGRYSVAAEAAGLRPSAPRTWNSRPARPCG